MHFVDAWVTLRVCFCYLNTHEQLNFADGVSITRDHADTEFWTRNSTHFGALLRWPVVALSIRRGLCRAVGTLRHVVQSPVLLL